MTTSASVFVITFGDGHHDEKNGDLGNCCTKITADSEIEAMLAITSVRGEKWCGSYTQAEGERMIKKFRVQVIPFDEIGPQIGPNR